GLIRQRFKTYISTFTSPHLTGLPTVQIYNRYIGRYLSTINPPSGVCGQWCCEIQHVKQVASIQNVGPRTDPVYEPNDMLAKAKQEGYCGYNEK
ncbi:hypothetical protein KUTeg_015805, partial [Tegillarca granosa]